ncbi:hypothetical protein ACFFKB_10840 [Mameliella alba]|uniref:hypothetical protein n=1 Tax=Mameliella alba TaxID=561184 RepID=UPI0010561E1F|nr:hypothetical protein [Mameliella alba]
MRKLLSDAPDLKVKAVHLGTKPTPGGVLEFSAIRRRRRAGSGSLSSAHMGQRHICRSGTKPFSKGFQTWP